MLLRMLDRDTLIARFARGDAWFDTSPLYRVLSRTVAADDDLLELAAEARPGQQPANMLMAATHLLVLKNPELPFARFFPSVRGDDAEPPEGAGAEFGAFCAEHRDELVAILRERLVQTNAPGRGVAVRLAMHEIGRRVSGPVNFLEIGPSAGIQLHFDRWAVETAGLRFGPTDAPLTLRAEWRSEQPPPDLDDIPLVRDRLGIDLDPVDATDPEQRLWLQALVWPEHRDRFTELATALDAIAADPPEILQGDAIELLPRLDLERLADDIPLVVFHAMVRIHVPADRRAAFDAAITALGERRRAARLTRDRSTGLAPRPNRTPAHPARLTGRRFGPRPSRGPRPLDPAAVVSVGGGCRQPSPNTRFAQWQGCVWGGPPHPPPWIVVSCPASSLWRAVQGTRTWRSPLRARAGRFTVAAKSELLDAASQRGAVLDPHAARAMTWQRRHSAEPAASVA